VIARLRNSLADIPVRWVHGGNIHLTLKFLGDVSVANVDMIKKILQSESARQTAFEVSIGGIGAYPTAHRPRVIWVGVEAPAELSALQVGIENEMARLGYPREDRQFSPHLTLGRVSRNTSTADIHAIARVLESYKIGFLGVASVTEIYFYKSTLNPAGAFYTRLYAAPLAQGTVSTHSR
jgi:2'-5' RNA ligase